MEYLYYREHRELEEQCPPPNYTGHEIVAYRWIFDQIQNPINFVPQFFKNPKRFNSKDDLTKCVSMSLSMWNSEKASISRFEFLKNNVLGDRVFRILGNKLAIGTLEEHHGANSEIENNGHFSHHQSNITEYHNLFRIIKDLQ